MGQVTSLPLDFNPFHLLKIDFHHHSSSFHHAHHKSTTFAEGKHPPNSEKPEDAPDPNIDYTKRPARAETCCCTEIYVEKVPPQGEVRLVPDGPMLYHWFDYAEASNSCDSGTHGPSMALDSSGHYWCAPGYQLDNGGHPVPQTVTYTAGLLGKTGRFPAYGIQIDFAHLPAIINGVRVQAYEHGEWEDMIPQTPVMGIFGKGVDKGSVLITFPMQKNIHEVQIGMTGAMNEKYKTMAIQRIDLVESNPAGMTAEGNFNSIDAYWKSHQNHTTQAYELGVAEGLTKRGPPSGALAGIKMAPGPPGPASAAAPAPGQQQLLANGNLAQQNSQVITGIASTQQGAVQGAESQMMGAATAAI